MPYVPPVAFTTLTRHEPIGEISVSALNTEYTLPNRGGLLPMNRFMFGLRLTFEGRITMPAAGGPSAVRADDRYALIEEVTVDGFHIGRGQQEEFFRLRGPEIRQLARIYTGHEPLSTPSSFSFAGGATNDVRFMLDVPFVPLAMPWKAQLGWLLDAPNYRDLRLRVRVGDGVSIFTSNGSTVTFSAYGSASGNPRILVDGIFALGGPSRFAGYTPGRIFRYYREITGSPMTTTANDVRLFDLPTGFGIRGLLLKTGTKATVTSGNNAYATLSDDILTEVRIYRGLNTINRHYRSFHAMREDHVGAGSVLIVPTDTGYALLDWARLGWDGELLNTSGLVAGPSGSVDLFLQANVAGASDQALLVALEEWRYVPFKQPAIGRR